MRIFVAGATGVIGVRLVPLLVQAGHEVAGLTRSVEKTETLLAQGAEPVVCDVFDAEPLRDGVVSFQPEVVIHELTALPDDPQRIPEMNAANARIRREGTRNLLAAAHAAQVGRFLAQSVAWPLPGDSGKAVAYLEQTVLAAGGVVLRYGQFYGPGTYYESDPPTLPRIHIDEAARRTVDALDAPSGIIEIVEA